MYRTALARALGIAGLLMLGGCASMSHQTVSEDEASVVIGPAVRDNRTPLDVALACYGGKLGATLPEPLSIAVGAIQDYTGKYSDSEGNAITQGGSAMVFSALAKLGDGVRIQDRFDTRVAELELAYMEKRRLGDGQTHRVDGSHVPWLPYYGGTIQKSDFYIVGGITEINYNIQSGGAELRISQTGPRARVYTMNVAADLRIVNTSSLVVESAISVQKQITGYEIGFEVFRFFGGSDLIDINIGTKNQEPLQLGVRATLEFGILRLLQNLTRVGYEECLPASWSIPDYPPPARSVREARGPERDAVRASRAAGGGLDALPPFPSPYASAQAAEARVRTEPRAQMAESTPPGRVALRRARFGRHGSFTRLVLELAQPLDYAVRETGGDLVVVLPGASLSRDFPAPPAGDRVLGAASVRETPQGIEIRLVGRSALATEKAFALKPGNGNPNHRIVVDARLARARAAKRPETSETRSRATPPADPPRAAPAAPAPSRQTRAPAAEAVEAANQTPAPATAGPGAVLQGAPVLKLN